MQKECGSWRDAGLSSSLMTPWSVAGFVLIVLGLERLANLGLLGGELTSYPVRLLFAAAAMILGSVLLALARRFSSR